MHAHITNSQSDGAEGCIEILELQAAVNTATVRTVNDDHDEPLYYLDLDTAGGSIQLYCSPEELTDLRDVLSV